MASSLNTLNTTQFPLRSDHMEKRKADGYDGDLTAPNKQFTYVTESDDSDEDLIEESKGIKTGTRADDDLSVERNKTKFPVYENCCTTCLNMAGTFNGLRALVKEG
jgi:hypothetical protein